VEKQWEAPRKSEWAGKTGNLTCSSGDLKKKKEQERTETSGAHNGEEVHLRPVKRWKREGVGEGEEQASKGFLIAGRS